MNRPIKVMLIDDDPGIHESLRAVVEEAGYEFCGALGGREGLRLLDDEHPDLLLLDVMMPGMNGFDVCQQMREEGRRIPVIFLTAKNDIVDKSTGFKACLLYTSRTTLVGPYIIYYRYNATTLTVYRIMHQRQSIDTCSLIEY